MRALMTRKSCAVEMRSAILGNHFKAEANAALNIIIINNYWMRLSMIS